MPMPQFRLHVSMPVIGMIPISHHSIPYNGSL